MSMNERSGKRDLLYSAWHRPNGGRLEDGRKVPGIARFLGPRRAAQLTVIDIDWCEACHACSTPLALIETQAGDRPPKSATITVALAALSGVPAYSVSFRRSKDGADIDAFRWTRLWPASPVCDLWHSPAEYAEWLWELRRDHESDCRVLRVAS
jgi:hypothetical protein